MVQGPASARVRVRVRVLVLVRRVVDLFFILFWMTTTMLFVMFHVVVVVDTVWVRSACHGGRRERGRERRKRKMTKETVMLSKVS